MNGATASASRKGFVVGAHRSIVVVDRQYRVSPGSVSADGCD
jgi:hypothetical protein